MATEFERLDVGGMVFCTTRSTLMKRDKGSVLALMARGKEKRSVVPRSTASSTFIDRDGTHFRHVLNWLRDGVVTPELERTAYRELLREAEYYQLQGLVEAIKPLLIGIRDETFGMIPEPEMSRLDVIKCIQFGNVRMRGVDLSMQNLSKLDLSGVDFSHCRLINTDFHMANLQNANFADSVATGTNFQDANLNACKFTCASMIGAMLSNANLTEASLELVTLEKADLSSANLENANLSHANLSFADLNFANFTNANLRGADLRSANLNSTILNNAKLSGAHLRSADLSTANFQNSDLSGAQVSGPQLLGAILDVARRGKASAKKSTKKKLSAVEREKESVRPMRPLIEPGHETLPIESLT